VRQQLGGPLVLVWDNLNTHVSRAMRQLAAARDWLTVFQGCGVMVRLRWNDQSPAANPTTAPGGRSDCGPRARVGTAR
jgi:hypothetical protein